jgi:hypothetical protein
MLPSLGAKSFGVQRRVRGEGQKPDIVRKPDFWHLQNKKYYKSSTIFAWSRQTCARRTSKDFLADHQAVSKIRVEHDVRERGYRPASKRGQIQFVAVSE